MKYYSAHVIDSRGKVGSVIAQEYPNKKDLLAEVSKIINRYGIIDIRFEVVCDE